MGQAVQGRHLAPLAVATRRPTAIQRMEEEVKESGSLEGTVAKVHSGLLKEGPGNLNTSTQTAKKLFSLAAILLDKLREYREIGATVLDVLSRMHLGLSDEFSMKYYINNVAEEEEAIKIGNFKKQDEIVKEKGKLTELATAVYFDFVLKKTGGGSCDHCSAGVFFNLIDENPNAQVAIVKFKPISTEEYEIQHPESLPYHRTVFLKDEQGGHELDAWWPGGKIGKVQNQSDYPGLEPVVKWKSKYKGFVDALRLELEHQYNIVKGDLPEDTEGDVSAVWTILNK